MITVAICLVFFFFTEWTRVMELPHWPHFPPFASPCQIFAICGANKEERLTTKHKPFTCVYPQKQRVQCTSYVFQDAVSFVRWLFSSGTDKRKLEKHPSYRESLRVMIQAYLLPPPLPILYYNCEEFKAELFS